MPDATLEATLEAVPEIRHRVIFDTDIGTDVDDILALGVLLGSPEVALEAVTTVYGDVELRARMVQRLLQLRHRGDVPVHTGVGAPLLGRVPVYWPGHEGVGLVDADEVLPAPSALHAVDALIGAVLANPGEITLLAVGPLTNVATAFIREPRVASAIKRLVIMGGQIGVGADGGPVEHNIRCDPEAAHVVFTSGAPIELVPLDVTLQTMIRDDGVDALRVPGDPYHAALADQVARYPGFVERGGMTYLHDPLAAAAVVRPELLVWKELHVAVELNGTLTTGMTVAARPTADRPANARVALDLDVAASEAVIAERLAA